MKHLTEFNADLSLVKNIIAAIGIYIQLNLDNSNCRGLPKSLSYEKFEL